MENFAYYRPKTAEQAVELLDGRWGTAELLGGGTDLLALMKQYVATPKKVISLAGLGDAYRRISHTATSPPTLQLGGGVTLAALAADAQVRKWATALAMAAEEIAGPQIRNMGTLGGNLCQRNRCWYFRDDHSQCLLKGGDKCFALDGENRYHAVFTRGNKCVIAHPSTLATALLALGAVVNVIGPRGNREIDIARFYKTPAGPGDREHTLAPDEMVTAVRIEARTGVRSAAYEVRQKLSSDWPLVQVSVAFRLEGGKAHDVRVALGHVAPTPLLSAEAAKAVEGKAISDEVAAAAGEAATSGARPLAQNAYKVRLLAVAVKRALLTAAGAKKYWEA